MYDSRMLVPKQAELLAPQLDYILVDGSGSMSDKWRETLAGLRNFMSVLHAENIHSHGILHVFDTANIEYIQRDDKISEWDVISTNSVSMPGGGTPLYDAINIMVRRIAELDPPRCSIVIVTDGMEADSKITSQDQARNLLDWCRAKGYQVTFLGSDFNNDAQAAALGANERNSIGVTTALLGEAGKLLGKKRVDNARSGRDIDFTGDEKSSFGGYLTKQ
jgi:hypothetical protein